MYNSTVLNMFTKSHNHHHSLFYSISSCGKRNTVSISSYPNSFLHHQVPRGATPAVGYLQNTWRTPSMTATSWGSVRFRGKGNGLQGSKGIPADSDIALFSLGNYHLQMHDWNSEFLLWRSSQGNCHKDPLNYRFLYHMDFLLKRLMDYSSIVSN